MRKFFVCTLFLLAFAAALPAQETPRFELFGGYSGLRSNQPPSACGCFYMNGGSGSAAYNLNSWVGIVGEIGATHTGNVNSTGLGLTITSYLFGPRVSYRHEKRFTPFAQLLIGGAHQSGSFIDATTGSANQFALAFGGGLDVRLYRHLAVRPIQLEYLRTGFSNGVNGGQNNFRLTTGVVFRFGEK